MEKLKVKSIAMQQVARFKELKVGFKQGVNVICGTNGVGKTTILDAIASSFVGQNHLLAIKGRAGSNVPGRIELEYATDDIGRSRTMPVAAFHETFSPSFSSEQTGSPSRFVVYLKANRDFSYSRREAIVADVPRSDRDTQTQLLTGASAAEIKQWFANRFLFRPHSNQWPPHHVENYDLSVGAFSVLDSKVRLSHVDTVSFDIIVSTPDGDLPFELLSSGFRSVYSVVLGLIKEIEFRRLGVPANQFAGVILIDEVDLHLHPSWQQRILPVLSQTFPKAQIIASTHSPHVIQTASSGAVIPLIDGPEGPEINHLSLSEYGFVGWTIEEILRDVMGLDDIVAPELRNALRDFDEAVQQEDVDAARSALATLELMLHPASHLRKILRLQAAPLIGGGA